MIGKLIDSVVSAVNPIAGLRRAQARKVLRSYQGGEPSRVSSNRHPKNNPADIELSGPFGANQIRAWARDLVRNNSYAWGVVDTIVSSVVGCGIRAQSTFETPAGDDVEAINDSRDKIWGEWCEVCDINGQHTFDELQALCQREMVEAGEVLIRILPLPSTEYKGISRPVPLALEIIEADRLAGDKDTYASGISPANTNRIVRGVEVDDLLPEPDVPVHVGEVAVGRAAELVGGPVLVNEPGHLVGVAREVRWELRPDDQVDRRAVALAEIEQAPGANAVAVLAPGVVQHVRCRDAGHQVLDQALAEYIRLYGDKRKEMDQSIQLVILDGHEHDYWNQG